MGHRAGLGAVAMFEERLRSYYGMRYALCTSSATTALHGLALALGMRNEEFVTTPITYGATLAGWLLERNRPVFADVDADTLTIDPVATSAVAPGTRALLAVDIFGVPCDDEALRQVADTRGIWYIADASQSFGATRADRPASALADAVVLSFTIGKALDVGEGGAVVTSDGALYDRLLWFTQHPDRQRRELGLDAWNEFGLNGRMHPSAARLAVRRFDRALTQVSARQKRILTLVDALNGSGLTRPIAFAADEVMPSFFALTAAWGGAPQPRALLAYLAEVGWRVRLRAMPAIVYRQPAYTAMYPNLVPRASCPVAERETRDRILVEVTDY